MNNQPPIKLTVHPSPDEQQEVINRLDPSGQGDTAPAHTPASPTPDASTTAVGLVPTGLLPVRSEPYEQVGTAVIEPALQSDTQPDVLPR